MLHLLPLILVCPTPDASGVAASVWSGAPGTPGDVRVLDVQGNVLDAPPALAGIRFLPIDASGRSDVTDLLPGRARLRSDVPGAARLALPGGGGSLYHYERPGPASTDFGLLWVDPSGCPHVVFELGGTGPLADADPFTASVAVDPAGSAVLVATTPAAGGDVYEVALPPAGATLRSAGLPPLAVGQDGLFLGASFGLVATPSGVWRFDRSSPGDATAVPFGTPPPAWFSGELAPSVSGTAAATAAGDSPSAARAYALTASGPAVPGASVLQALTGAGLGGTAGGPWLAVSDDGACLAWRTLEQGANGPSHEVWLANVGAQPVPPVQASGDASFTDTLDEVGQFLVIGSKLVVTIGEKPIDPLDPDPFDNADVFSVALDPQTQAPLFENLTLTSGQSAPPFTAAPTLHPRRTLLLPAADAVLVQGTDALGDRLVRVAPGQPPVELLTNAKKLSVVETTPSGLIAVLRRSTGTKPYETFALDPLTSQPTFLATLANSDEPIAPTAAAGWVAFVTPSVFIGETVWRVDAAAGSVTRLTPRLLAWQGPLDLTASGTLASAVGPPLAPATYVRWLPGFGPYRLDIGTEPGIVLAR